MEGGVKHEDTMTEAATLSQAPHNSAANAASAPTTRKRGSTNSDPAAKRARQTRRHDDWWLPDGSVVLELHGVHFRLYRAQLARKSPFFEKLFAEPASETVDDCPLYVLQRGTPDELAALLKAVDYGLSEEYLSKKPAFADIVPVLRMATFYDFPRARAWAVSIAEYYWPSRLEDPIEGTLNNAVDALLLGRECDVPRILKGCLFILLDGLSDAHPTLMPNLPTADIQRLLTARAELQRRWVRQASHHPDMKCLGAATAINCLNRTGRGRHQSHAWMEVMHLPEDGKPSMFEEGLSNPIRTLDTLSSAVDWPSFGYCETCAAAMAAKWAALRVQWWDDLDALFGLEDSAP